MAKWGLRFGDKANDPFLKRLVENPKSVHKDLRQVYKKEFEELEQDREK